MSGSNNKHKVTVETLLQLKKNERPKADFWDSFERDFDRRRLHALVERPSWRDLILSPAFKVFALGMPALAIVALALVWNPAEQTASPVQLVINDAEPPVDEPVVPNTAVAKVEAPKPIDLQLDTSRASSQFVVDAIQDRSGPGTNFRKVLYTPAIRLSVPSGASYVRDNLSTSNYKVTTADAKLGRNF